jgi:hypothetical protein
VFDVAQIELARLKDEEADDGEVERAPEDVPGRGREPLTGGFANGLWKGRPITRLTRCGIAFARNRPPKKYETP